MLDDAADVEQRVLREAGIAVAGEQVLAVLPHRLVDVHARTVVADDGLGHEGGRLAVGMGHVLHHVLLQLHPVGALQQRAELGTDFHLAGVRHLVVMHFDRNAERLEDQTHLGAHVLERVDRRRREVAALHRGPVAGVAVLVLLAGVPGPFLGLDLRETARHVVAPAHAVEHEELGFRAEERGVAQARGLHVGLGTLGQRPWVALVGLAVAGFDHVAGQEQRRLLEERVDVGGVRVRHQQHVRSLDALPASDRRPVERVARTELVLIEMGHRHGHVLFLATGVGEAEIDELDFVFLHHLHHVGDGLGHQQISWQGKGLGGGESTRHRNRTWRRNSPNNVAESMPAACRHEAQRRVALPRKLRTLAVRLAVNLATRARPIAPIRGPVSHRDRAAPRPSMDRRPRLALRRPSRQARCGDPIAGGPRSAG